jgi:hypothetical protein
MLPKIRLPDVDWQITLRIIQKLLSELRIRQVDVYVALWYVSHCEHTITGWRLGGARETM